MPMTSYSDDESDSSNIFDLDSPLDGIDDDIDDEAWLYEDKVQRPPEHYPAEAENPRCASTSATTIQSQDPSPARSSEVAVRPVRQPFKMTVVAYANIPPLLRYCSYVKKEPVQCFRDVSTKIPQKASSVGFATNGEGKRSGDAQASNIRHRWRHSGSGTTLCTSSRLARRWTKWLYDKGKMWVF